MPRACRGVFLSHLVRVWQRRKALGKYTVPDRQGSPPWFKERPPLHTRRKSPASPRPAQPQSHPRGDWSELVGFSGCSPGSLSGREICGRLWLEVVLAKGCGRGALLQPLDMAGVAKQVVLQRVASVTIFIIELQAAVLK